MQCLCGCGAVTQGRKKFLPEHRQWCAITAQLERFLARGDGCWVWIGETNIAGYGRLSYGKKPRKRALVHRIMWEREHGPIPENTLILHHCDVRNCGRPSHLHPGDKRQNIREAIDRGLARFPKLTENAVHEIFNEPKTYGYRVRLAKRFGVTVSAISQVIYGYNWKHIYRPE